MFGKKKENKVTRDLGFDENFTQEPEARKETGKKKTKKINKKKGKKNGIIVPRTVQDTIPYVAVYKNGIIETEPGVFTKTYRLEDVNFKIATDEAQATIFEHYVDFLNTFDYDVRLQLVIYNRNMDERHVRERILLPYRDTLNALREEYNEMLKDKMSEGRNNITKEKDVTVSIVLIPWMMHLQNLQSLIQK